MSANITLDTQVRTVFGKKVKNLRAEGIVPATVYGKGFDPVSVQLDYKTFEQTYQRAGKTSLITLNIPEQSTQAVFIQDIQRHPVTKNILHADFRVVDLQVEITTEVSIHLVGESPLVERGDASLNHGIQALEVRALPSNIPHHIEIDISTLESFDTSICVRDLPAVSGYAIVTSDDTMIVSLTQTKSSLAEEATQAETEMAEPQLIRKERELE